jgi:hypothetical protein
MNMSDCSQYTAGSSDYVNCVLANETARLNEKTQSANNQIFGQKRVLQLNQNFQLRTQAFNWILCVIFIILAIMVILLFIGRFFPATESFISLAISLDLGIGACYILYLYAAFYNRDPNDFNQIVMPPPPTMSAAQAAAISSANALNQSNNLGSSVPQQYCEGSECCVSGSTIWSYDQPSNTGGCCAIGNSWSYDQTSKTGSCCPTDKIWNGTACV